jgi:hypothetical protein
MRCPKNPFMFGCIYAEYHVVLENHISFKVFDTHLGARYGIYL